MKTPSWWYQKSSIGTLLAPIGLLYGHISQICKQPTQAAPIPVLCIGNVVAGGGGKTPVALAIGQWCKANHINAFFISRGYGGTIKNPTLVNAHHTAKDVGDEPLLLAKCLPTVVGRNRFDAVSFAKEKGATLAILDDGLQNTSIEKTKSILVLKGENPLGNGHRIPAGPLREPLAQALNRVDAVVWVDLPSASNLNIPHPLFSAQTSLTIPAKKLAAFAGIARPELFKQALETAGAEVVTFTPFADHHTFTPHEIKSLIEAAKQANVPLVTTEKDWVRLPAEVQSNIIPIPLTLHFDDKEAFDTWLSEHLLSSAHRAT